MFPTGPYFKSKLRIEFPGPFSQKNFPGQVHVDWYFVAFSSGSSIQLLRRIASLL